MEIKNISVVGLGAMGTALASRQFLFIHKKEET